MSKWNPANKQIAEFENRHEGEEETVDDLLEKYNEVKDGTDVSLDPHDVRDFLPESVEWDGNKLLQYEPHDDSVNKTSLTPLKKEVLRALDNGLTPHEIDEQDIASSSYGFRTREDFGFIIESPAMKQAFLSHGRVMSEWKLVHPDDDVEISYSSRAEAIKDYSKISEAFGIDPVVLKDGEEISINEDDNEESQESQDDAESFEKFADPLDTEDWKMVVAALHRDEQDDLASYILDTFL